MVTSQGIAYFGSSELQGSLRDRVLNAIDNDIMSMQVKMTDISSFSDFDDYSGEIVCYLDDVKWDDSYFQKCYLKVAKLKAIGLTRIVVPASLEVASYKKMEKDDRLKLFHCYADYLINFADLGVFVSVFDDQKGVFVGNVLVPMIHGMREDLMSMVGYAVCISENDGEADMLLELGLRNIQVVNIEPVVDSGEIVYDRSRALIGNVYSFFIKKGVNPSMFAVASKLSLFNVTNLFSLFVGVCNLIASKLPSVSNGYSKTRVMNGYHPTGVSAQASAIFNMNSGNAGFIDFLQMFFLLLVIGLVGVCIAVILVIL